MSFSDRLYYFAIKGCLIAGLFFALASEGSAQSNTVNPTQPPQQPQGVPSAAPVVQQNVPDLSYYTVNCQRPKDRDEADLCEQRRQAQAAEDAVWWTAFQTKLGIGGFAVVAITLIFTGWAAFAAANAVKVANKSAAIAETALRVSERAKLWVDQIAVSNFVAGEMPRAVYRLTNSGRTHAEIISVQNGCAVSTEEAVPEIPPYKSDDQTRPGIVGPNSAQEMSLAFRGSISPEEASDIAAGRKFFFVYGRIVCRDEFQWTCEVGFGGQYGNYGDGDMLMQFMKRPGYTYIRWHPPGQGNGAERA